MRDILIIGTARESSSRLESKMTRPFADTTLFDIHLSKMEAIENALSCKVAMAINKNDTILWQKTIDSNLDIIERSDESVSKGAKDRSVELGFLKDCKQESIVWLNGCYPFIKISTIVEVIEHFNSYPNISALHCVSNEQNWYWDANDNPINNKDPKCTGTQYCDVVYSSMHFMHIFNRQHMMTTGSYWGMTSKYDPYLYKMKGSSSAIEFLDIDNQAQFELCETIYKIEQDS